MPTIRELPRIEWSRLANHPSLHGLALPDPSAARLIVAEEAGEIVAYWFLVAVLHAEPIWIAPQYRGTTLVKRLWQRLRSCIDTCAPSAFCFSEQSRPEVGRYLERLGLRRLNYEIYQYLGASPCPLPSSPPPSSGDPAF